MPLHSATADNAVLHHSHQLFFSPRCRARLRILASVPVLRIAVSSVDHKGLAVGQATLAADLLLVVVRISP